MTLRGATSALGVEGLAERIARVRQGIASAAERSGRDPAGITLVAVTKGQPPAVVAAAIEAGLEDIGENRVQEAVAKRAEVEAMGARAARWHLVGHLQTNKVPAALRTFAILQTVDSPRMLEVIASRAQSPVGIMIEVNVAGEPAKFGVAPDNLAGLVALARSTPAVSLQGLMTVAPQLPDLEQVRPFFRRLRTLAGHHGLAGISMGMSDDFEVAVEEGATCVRVGRALFGERRA